jgi:hypothetical protein
MLIRLQSLMLAMSRCYSELANMGGIAGPALHYCKADLHVTRGLRSVKRYIKLWRHDTTRLIAVLSPLAFFQGPSPPPPHPSKYRHIKIFSNISQQSAHYFWNMNSSIINHWLKLRFEYGGAVFIETLVITFTIVTWHLIHKQWSHFTATCYNKVVAP